MKANSYNSLFRGTLIFSTDPSLHLKDLEIVGAAFCLDHSVCSPIGAACYEKYQGQMLFSNSFKILYLEPLIIFRMLKYTLINLQDVSIDYLGTYAIEDSRASPCVQKGSDECFWSSATETTPLNLWSKLKYDYFPTGFMLIFVLLIFGGWFIFLLRLKTIGVYEK